MIGCGYMQLLRSYWKIMPENMPQEMKFIWFVSPYTSLPILISIFVIYTNK